eukprot:CAMPEP_0167761074 /NCGR_PEP_ID=MMETSP0110_2-20121227/11953_1 /TAXON_ID=629695 /ORGANISM="Gymnochlora sp., Strain CCMP2014" /LENGTH=814 /DNA_ID=CAMNT_0007647683 /DNA_START=1116 /DNA_END=3560 /DNA_ORIENTATION=+
MFMFAGIAEYQGIPNWLRKGPPLRESIKMLLKLYFTVYNVACAVGWMMCAAALAKHIHNYPNGAKGLWEDAGMILVITQGAAALEIVHSALKMTKSPFMQCFMQVMSRLLIVHGVLYPSKSAQSNWALYPLLAAYCTIEITRYVFYALKQWMKKVPGIVFYPRYSMFYVLYPLGITSELILLLASLPADFKAEWWANAPISMPNSCMASCSTCENYLGCQASVILFYVWCLATLFMIPAMHFTRKSALKKRNPRKPKPDTGKGILFPMINGQRSTQEAGKAIIAAAITGGSDVIPAAAAKARIERKWRFKYVRHFRAMFEASLESPEAAVNIAKAGTDFMHKHFQFRDANGNLTSFEKQMERKDTCLKGVYRIDNTESKNSAEFTVPYKKRGVENPLKGAEIKKLAEKWAAYGTIEPDAADALKKVVDNPKWLDLKDYYFVLIGASSAMGPYLKLMELGANVIALDIPGKWERPGGRPSPWRKIMKVAKDSKGKLIFPLSKKASECKTEDEIVKAAGGDLINQPADILNWLMNLDEVKDKKNHIVIGNYTYLDGGLHVLLSLASDAIMKEVAARRPKGKTTLCYLCTPTDLHVIPEDASKAAETNVSMSALTRPLSFIVESLLKVVSGGKWLVGNVYRKDSHSMVDGLVVNQGPNYALAKRLQHWRAILAYNEGIPVSSNIAPSTATLSVVKARTFKWAYGGIPFFKPYEIFDQETTNSVMTAALIHDLRSPASAANPKNKESKETPVTNCLELFKYTSFHGGVWRSGYKMDSLGVVSVLIYFLGGPSLFVPVSVSVAGALSAGFYSVLMATVI